MAFQGITQEQSIIFQIHELTWLEAYNRNSYLHFIDPWAAVAVYTDTQTYYCIPRLRIRTEA